MNTIIVALSILASSLAYAADCSRDSDCPKGERCGSEGTCTAKSSIKPNKRKQTDREPERNGGSVTPTGPGNPGPKG